MGGLVLLALICHTTEGINKGDPALAVGLVQALIEFELSRAIAL